ncbi:MAG: RNA polymerase subunit sigma-70, partial [Rhodospirillaceae bacterium]|nr:RNA polymerase subunit sigma-70 [Rhodospirillaceae bacterium]
FATWFNGGLRVIDVADPYSPQEVGHFMPAPVDGNASPQSNDVFVTDNGTIFLVDRCNGLDILEWQG